MGTPLTTVAPVAAALDARPFGLLCDVDGTLSPMAATPAEAQVTPRNRALLQALSGSILVAAVSGRNVADIQRMAGVPGLIYIGVHGLVWLIHGWEEIDPAAEPYRASTKQAVDDLAPLRRLTGVVMETKTAGLTIHYRLAPDRTATRQQILRAIAASPAASRFRVQEGILLIELRPPVLVTKGVALRRLAERFKLGGLLYLGDDITDIDAFREARKLREAGALTAFGVAVAHAEAPPEAQDAADFTLKDVGEVEWLLSEIAAHFGVRPGDSAR